VPASEDFLEALGHAMRVPLPAMVDWLQVLRQGGGDAGVRDRPVDVLERRARLQARLADDLLEVARVVGGALPLDAVDLDVATVVRGVVLEAAAAALGKGVVLTLAGADRLVPARGDAGQLASAFAGLLDNAIRFTPEGGRVDVAVSAADGLAAVAVHDTGDGMSAETVQTLFTRPAMADPARDGLGTGLVIARWVVEAHGGRLTAASPGPGRGAVFTARLPLGKA
jgi:signal transduction histidine kinase